MAFTAASIQTAVQAKGYGADTAAQQIEFLRAVLRRLYGQRRWRFLRKIDATLTIATGVSTASLAAITDRQAGKLEGVRLVPSTGDTLELHEREWEELRALDAEDHTNDQPLYYARIDNTTLQFWPRPDQIYTIQLDYISLPTLPAVAGDTVTWPDEHMDVLVWGVIMDLAFRQRDWFSTPTAQQMFGAALDEMQQADGLGPSQSPARMGHWAGWDDVAR